jgi:hypothetical protein
MYYNNRKKWLWDHYKHSETVFTNRINFFLLAESMFLVSYATLLSGKERNLYTIEIISVLGFLFTGVWLCVNYRTRKRLSVIIKRFETVCPEIKQIRDEIIGVESNWFLGIILPIITLIAWVLLSLLPFSATPLLLIKTLALVISLETLALVFIISYLIYLKLCQNRNR